MIKSSKRKKCKSKTLHQKGYMHGTNRGGMTHPARITPLEWFSSDELEPFNRTFRRKIPSDVSFLLTRLSARIGIIPRFFLNHKRGVNYLGNREGVGLVEEQTSRFQSAHVFSWVLVCLGRIHMRAHRRTRLSSLPPPWAVASGPGQRLPNAATERGDREP